MILNSSSEFGRLDVSHLGVWLNLDRVPAETNSTPMAELLSAAVQYKISDQHREVVEAAGTAEGRAALVGLFTSVEHEARHFHDLLVSPYGHYLMELNARAAFSIFGAWRSLHGAGALVVPLADWESQLPVLRVLDKELTAPNAKLAELADVLRGISHRQQVLNRGILHPDVKLTSTSILEASALLVQVGAAGAAFGLERANELMHLIGSGSAADRYFGPLSYIEHHLGHIPGGGLAVILLGALSGDVFSDDERAIRSPVDVLVDMISWLAAKENFPVRNMVSGDASLELIVEIYNLVSEFLSSTIGRDIEDSMSEAWETTNAMVRHWQDRLSGKGDDSMQWFRIREMLRVYENYRDVGGSLMANFYRQPAWYLIDQYLDLLPRLPQPVTFYWSDSGIPASPSLAQDFYIQNELIVPAAPDRLLPTDGSNEILAEFVNRSYYDGEAYRMAFVISPLEAPQPEPAPNFLPIPLNHVDHEAWLGYFDGIVPLMRLLMEGSEAHLPWPIQNLTLSLFELLKTKVYSGAGRMHYKGSLPTPELRRQFDTRYPNWPQRR